MESDVKNPTWKMIGGYIVVIALLVFIALMMSCGSRTSEISINKTSEKTKEQSSSQGQVKKESGSQETKSSVQATNTVDEDKSVVVTEKFDKGELKERTTETKNIKRTDNSTKTKNKVKYVYNTTDSLFKTETYKMITITTHKKDKETESSNSQWAWVAGIVLVVLVLAYFVYKRFTRPKI